MKRWYINFFLLLAGPCVALEAEVSAQAYIDTSLAVWEARYEHCKSQERSRPLPDQSILDRLRDYEDEQVRTYLVSRSQQAIEECTRQEAGDLSYTLLAIINSSETTPAERKEAERLGQMLHIGTWAMKVAAQRVPVDMRDELGTIDYFAEPFSGFRLLEALDIR